MESITLIFDHIQNTIRVVLAPEKLPMKSNRQQQQSKQSIGYSYIRFSTPEQAKGDSLRRQTELRDHWCKANNVRLDSSLTLRDEGVSGFTGEHRQNPDRHGLACFLEAVRTGRVTKGAYLIVENLDRLSREDIVPAINLFTGILLSGVNIVQLVPHEQVYNAKSDMMEIMRALLELSRGNSESRRKSGMLAQAWIEKRRRAATDVLTNRLPGWVINTGGKLKLHPENARTVRLIFRLSSEGYGVERIVKRLNGEGICTFTGRPAWSISTVHKILTSRAAVGDYQPHTGSGTGGRRLAVGESIPDYYPRIVSDGLFARVQQAFKNRFQGGGRTDKHINLFAGLLRDARDGGAFVMANAKRRPSAIITLNAKHGIAGAVWSTFPLAEFERAVVSLLAEIKPEEVLPQAPAESRAFRLAGELAAIEARLAKLKTLLMDTDEAEQLVHTVRDLAAKRTRLMEQLEEARTEEASPLAEAWASVRPLADAMDAQEWSDDARLRLRSAIRRVVDSIWLLVMPAKKGQTRVAAVQLWFKEGERSRDYLITVKPAKANGSAKTEGEVAVRSVSKVGLNIGDLRDRKWAAKAEKLLRGMELGGGA
jgi:DNA invertase Pin-like site-specific DNA recombinase